MRVNIFKVLLLFIAIVIVSYNVPTGWIKGGSQPDKYDMGTDINAGENGANAATIKSIDKGIKGFGSLKQIIAADNYKGKRVRLTANIRGKNVENGAAFFLRMEGSRVRQFDGKKIKVTISEDNMANRVLRGTFDWTKCEIVSDVPDSAVNIIYAAYLNGTGQVWFDNIKFEVVGTDVNTTSSVSKTPSNLDFQK